MEKPRMHTQVILSKDERNSINTFAEQIVDMVFDIRNKRNLPSNFTDETLTHMVIAAQELVNAIAVQDCIIQKVGEDI